MSWIVEIIWQMSCGMSEHSDAMLPCCHWNTIHNSGQCAGFTTDRMNIYQKIFRKNMFYWMFSKRHRHRLLLCHQPFPVIHTIKVVAHGHLFKAQSNIGLLPFLKSKEGIILGGGRWGESEKIFGKRWPCASKIIGSHQMVPHNRCITLKWHFRYLWRSISSIHAPDKPVRPGHRPGSIPPFVEDSRGLLTVITGTVHAVGPECMEGWCPCTWDCMEWWLPAVG